MSEYPHGDASAANWGVPGSHWEVQNPAHDQTGVSCPRSVPSPQHSPAVTTGVSLGSACSPCTWGAPCALGVLSLGLGCSSWPRRSWQPQQPGSSQPRCPKHWYFIFRVSPMARAPQGRQGPCVAAADRAQPPGAWEPGCKMPQCPPGCLRSLLAALCFNLWC